MFQPIFYFVLAIAIPFAARLWMLPGVVTDRVLGAIAAVALAVFAFVLVWRLWRRAWVKPGARVPDPARIRRLRWPHDLDAAELEAHCTAWLRGEGWAVSPAVSDAADGTFLRVRRDGAEALMLCDASRDALRPLLVRGVALVADGLPPARPVLLRQGSEPFTPAAEASARAAGVVLLRVSELGELPARLAAMRPRARAPEPDLAMGPPER